MVTSRLKEAISNAARHPMNIDLRKPDVRQAAADADARAADQLQTLMTHSATLPPRFDNISSSSPTMSSPSSSSTSTPPVP
jgi:hypothetical protein